MIHTEYIIKSYVKRLANEYNQTALLLWIPNLIEGYEDSKEMSETARAAYLTQILINTNLIQLNTEQINKLEFKLFQMINEIKKVEK